ncbi:MAG: DUF6691 family protein [Myxococcota bacterium]
MSRWLPVFAAGLLFAFGLAVSGMSDPNKVLGFLDPGGTGWDPSLALVMVGAIGVHAPLVAVARRTRSRPWASIRFDLPTLTRIDRNLVGGAALFGIGWGIAGYCPGPAVMSLASGTAGAVLFVFAMTAGMWGYDVFHRWQNPIDG